MKTKLRRTQVRPAVLLLSATSDAGDRMLPRGRYGNHHALCCVAFVRADLGQESGEVVGKMAPNLNQFPDKAEEIMGVHASNRVEYAIARTCPFSCPQHIQTNETAFCSTVRPGDIQQVTRICESE